MCPLQAQPILCNRCQNIMTFIWYPSLFIGGDVERSGTINWSKLCFAHSLGTKDKALTLLSKWRAISKDSDAIQLSHLMSCHRKSDLFAHHLNQLHQER